MRKRPTIFTHSFFPEQNGTSGQTHQFVIIAQAASLAFIIYLTPAAAVEVSLAAAGDVDKGQLNAG